MFVPKSISALQEGYRLSTLRQDALAGLTVAIVALPLAMAIAIASGTTPDKGLYTAIVAGFLISALGGSRHQIGGPTAAFVIVVYGVIEKHGFDGLVIATLMAGAMLIVFGALRLGNLIKFIPYPVVTGFTAGIALTILSTQIKDFFGLDMAKVPADFIAKWSAYAEAAPSFDAASTAIALFTLVVIVLVRRFKPSWPGMLIGVVAATLIVHLANLPVETIEGRFGAIPNHLPTPELPQGLSWARMYDLLPSAITIALLAGIESLLSCVIADGMTGRRHRSNIELIGQGVANMASALFAGLPATGALARTATNIKAGAQTPVSGMLHAVFLLLFMWLLAPLAGLVPLAALAGVLVIVAWNMSEIERLRHFVRAPRGDQLVLAVTFLLTVLIDITVALEVGIVLAALVFIRRMVETTDVTPVGGADLARRAETEAGAKALAALHVPKGVEVFEISGPFFFGITAKLADILDQIEAPPKVFILRMGNVPLIDASGVDALIGFIEKNKLRGTKVLLTRVQPQPLRIMTEMGLTAWIGKDALMPNLSTALEYAKTLIENETATPPATSSASF
ncbi:sulfate permease [uncultured Ferrovibrio sp.]|mgnify:FL=1|jgi:SulP family sulfate permease|uniref:SulP family inorganic anion transporter n=1 Tax=uncultured Ferrovibrio sp. TaxID=1576913 RepID=UPI002611E4B9|nr:sulfate permease [uncultured Ferrovibrio sp.]